MLYKIIYAVFTLRLFVAGALLFLGGLYVVVYLHDYRGLLPTILSVPVLVLAVAFAKSPAPVPDP